MNEEIVRRYEQMFGDEYNKVLASFSRKYVKSIRINTLKIKQDIIAERLKKKGFVLQKSEFNENSFKVLREKYSISSTPEYLMGYYFIQDEISSVPVLELNPNENELVLDMAASPGGKTTHMAELMKNKGCIVSLEINKDRMESLKANVSRLGVKNVVALRMDARRADELGLKFDKILLDAPCSGEGMMVRDRKRMDSLNLEEYNRFSVLQKELVDTAYKVLKKNGIVVYSTCSMAIEENESVIQYAIDKGFKLVKQENMGDEAKTEFLDNKFDKTMNLAKRFYPHKHGTGFFTAKMVKNF
ncbi:MAG: RsmB/NOP family class I SAM-dependent RNA methyltransferase [Candidatus Nanoarchaeia archaeon]|nr:RsmB/NOP family class I SAM-dependent RNA methyltransferase [Candidatus Nanoarchaeia archaeon]